MACTSAGDSKELSGLVALKASSSASLLFLANLLHSFQFVRHRSGQALGGGGGDLWRNGGWGRWRGIGERGVREGHGHLSIHSPEPLELSQMI